MSDRPDSSVEVVAYSEAWPVRFEQERAVLQAAVGDVAISIEHIGSTAVPGLAAKPTIDILLAVGSIDALRERIPAIEAAGYDLRPADALVGGDVHLFFRKVVDGKRTHHLHAVRSDSPEIADYRRFVDALRSDPDLAARYQALKLDLAARHATDRMAYVTEKSDWVDDVLPALRARGLDGANG